MGASKSFMSKTCYLNCPSLHSLPKFVLKTENILVHNDQFVGVLFDIPVVIDLQSHRFEMYTLVSEICDNIDMVIGIKHV